MMNTQDDLIDLRFFNRIIRRLLPNSQATALLIILVVGFLLVIYLSDVLMPFFIAVVLAYLLEGLICKLEFFLPRLLAVLLVFSGFIGVLAYFLFGLMPVLYDQAIQLIQHFPEMINGLRTGILRLPELYPQFISVDKIRDLTFAAQDEVLNYKQEFLSVSAASLLGLITTMVYLVLVPLMVFFFLKDKKMLVSWMTGFMPKDRVLSVQVWQEVDGQIGNYVRGKFVEVFLLGAVSYITFAAVGLNYAMLLAVFMGVQAIIPYIGATLVTFPVLGVAYFQWGMNDEFMYILIAYAVIQAIDGVVLVPLLFSEAVNLHPVAIVMAILFFGGMWGFWGVFFAIPLATLVKAVVSAWPKIGDTA